MPVYSTLATAAGTLLLATSAHYLANLASARRTRASLIGRRTGVVFLFQGEALVSATKPARARIMDTEPAASDWARFLALYAPQFPGLSRRIPMLPDLGEMVFDKADDGSRLLCTWHDGHMRIALEETPHEERDHACLRALEHENATLRGIVNATPVPLWQTNQDGDVTWANAPYLALSDARHDAASWPPAQIVDPAALRGPEPHVRIALDIPETADTWFDVMPRESGDGTVFTAIPATQTVAAETALEEFTQTFATTFSHLTIGLAIFDRERRLVVFNPALTDLTRLGSDFLVSKPQLTTFFDRLRDMHMLPEPRDYKSWRQHVEDLITAAEGGTFEECWTLPTGATYRVTGRPHADGAIGFVIEDITAEVSLTCRFRAEIETGQAVMNSLSEAIAVFARDGSLLMANDAYAKLWGHDPMETLEEANIITSTRLWDAKCAPGPMWTEARSFVTGKRDMEEWRGSARLWDGRRLKCRFTPLPSGRTLIGFEPERITAPLHNVLADRAAARLGA